MPGVAQIALPRLIQLDNTAFQAAGSCRAPNVAALERTHFRQSGFLWSTAWAAG
jgi:hypothetical protein